MEIEDTSAYAGVTYGLHNGDYDFRYVGKTTQKLEIRFNAHKRDAGSGVDRAVHRWMRKHGDSVQVCVIATFDEETIHLIDEVEIFHIAQCRAYNSRNLNMTAGGDGGNGQVYTPERRAKVSAASIGNQKALGLKHTAETKAKISIGSKKTTHTRWHTNRNLTNPNCIFCKEA